MKVMYHDFGENTTQQAGIEERKNGRISGFSSNQKWHEEMEYFHIILRELEMYFNQTRSGKTDQDQNSLGFWVGFILFMSRLNKVSLMKLYGGLVRGRIWNCSFLLTRKIGTV